MCKLCIFGPLVILRPVFKERSELEANLTIEFFVIHLEEQSPEGPVKRGGSASYFCFVDYTLKLHIGHTKTG